MSIERRIMKLLGEDEDGLTPPGSSQSLRLGEAGYATTYNNQGHELWLGADGLGWHVFYKAKDARRLAWFILWTWWTIGTWCGLKRRIYYWALQRGIERWSGRAPRE